MGFSRTCFPSKHKSLAATDRFRRIAMSIHDRQDMQDSTSVGTESASTVEEQLQKRFEEAVQRRRERLARKEFLSSEEGAVGAAPREPEGEPVSFEDEVEEKIHPSSGVDASETKRQTAETKARPVINDGSESKELTEPVTNENVGKSTKQHTDTLQRPEEKGPMEKSNNNEVHDGELHETTRPASERGQRERRTLSSEDEPSGRPKSAPPLPEGAQRGQRDYENPNSSFDEDIDDEDYSYFDHGYSSRKPTCEWETYRSTSVVFPRLAHTKGYGAPQRPKAIIHFVGGTFFG